jgi:uncharacterized Zn finger protein (UPF0148 family)
MAHFRCSECKAQGTFTYHGETDCPFCGAARLELAMPIEELQAVHPFDFELFVAERDDPEDQTKH